MEDSQTSRVFDNTNFGYRRIIPFEREIAAEEVAAENMLRLLDYPAYFDLLSLPLPEGRDAILSALEADTLVARGNTGRWNITNLCAVLLAKRLTDFRAQARKAVRVVLYKGETRVETVRKQEGSKGYAAGFEGLIGSITQLLPSNEVIGQALRKQVPMFPELAIRELVANALIHQDFHLTGTGPMVEIFARRLEVTNPGLPLVQTDRFLDSPPRSRNEALASFAGIPERHLECLGREPTRTPVRTPAHHPAGVVPELPIIIFIFIKIGLGDDK